jgi:alpha-L-fucosidase
MKKLFTSLFLFGMIAPFGASAQLQLKAEAPPNPDNEPVEVHPVPHPRQLKWQETEKGIYIVDGEKVLVK